MKRSMPDRTTYFSPVPKKTHRARLESECRAVSRITSAPPGRSPPRRAPPPACRMWPLLLPPRLLMVMVFFDRPRVRSYRFLRRWWAKRSKLCLLCHTSTLQSHQTWLGTCLCTFQVFCRFFAKRNQATLRTGLKSTWGQSERALRTCSPELLLAVDSPRVLGKTVVEKVCDIDTRVSPRLLLHPIYIHIKCRLAR